MVYKFTVGICAGYGAGCPPNICTGAALSIPPLRDQPAALVRRHLVFLDDSLDSRFLVWPSAELSA